MVLYILVLPMYQEIQFEEICPPLHRSLEVQLFHQIFRYQQYGRIKGEWYLYVQI